GSSVRCLASGFWELGVETWGGWTLDSGLWTLDGPANGVAHSLQNLARGRFSAPQFGQRLLRGAAHSIQNLAPVGFSEPQLAQSMMVLHSIGMRRAARPLGAGMVISSTPS